jgi:hypothetical protein
MYRTEVLERPFGRYICWLILYLKNVEIHSERHFAYSDRNLSSSILLSKPGEQHTYSTNPDPVSSLHSSVLVTVLVPPAHSHPNKAWAENMVKAGLEIDDFFTKNFLSGLLVVTTRKVAAEDEIGILEAAQNLG